MPTTLHALTTYGRSKEIWPAHGDGGWTTNRPVSPKLEDLESGEVNMTALTDYFARLFATGSLGAMKRALTTLEQSHLIEVQSVFNEIERKLHLGLNKSGFSCNVQEILVTHLPSIHDWYAAGMPLKRMNTKP